MKQNTSHSTRQVKNETKESDIHDTQDTILGVYRTCPIAGLTGRRFAVRLEDDSLTAIGIEVGEIVTALKVNSVVPYKVHILDCFAVGIIVRQMNKCDDHEDCYRLRVVGEKEWYCSDIKDFSILGRLFCLQPINTAINEKGN